MTLIVILLTIILCISISAYRMARDIQRDLDDLDKEEPLNNDHIIIRGDYQGCPPRKPFDKEEPLNNDRIIIRGDGWEPIDGKEDEK